MVGGVASGGGFMGIDTGISSIVHTPPKVIPQAAVTRVPWAKAVAVRAVRALVPVDRGSGVASP